MWKTRSGRPRILDMNTDADAARVRADPVQPHGAASAVSGIAVLAMSVVGLALSEQGIELAPGLPAWLAFTGFIGLMAMAIAAWVTQLERPRVTTGLSVTMVGLAVPSWAAWDWIPVALIPLLQATAPIAVAGAAHVGLGWASRMGRPRALAAVYVLAGLGAILMGAGYDPLADPGCAFTCADVDPLAGSLVSSRAAVTATAVLLFVAAAVAALSLARERRTPRELRLCAGASLASLVFGWGVHATRWTDPLSGVVLVAPLTIAASLLAAGVLGSWWVVRRNRVAADRLVAELSVLTDGGGVRGRAFEFAIPGEGRWVDSAGRPSQVQESGDRAVVIRDRGEPTVRVWLPPGTSAPALDAISRSTRVALSNARLDAVARARLEDVRESRRRIVRASDAERARIERDLHDGAQQRLIAASLHVSVAASRLPALSVDRAHTAIGEALEQLRRLAHGLVPDTLRSAGLREALDDLVRDADVPASLTMEEMAVDDDVGVAVYLTVMAVLAHASDARSRHAAVVVTRSVANRIGLQIDVWGPSGLGAFDESPVADRVGAIGGTMTVEASPTMLLLRAELPCAS